MLYIHDEEARLLYAVPLVPRVSELKTRRKQNRGWQVSTELHISRPDNFIIKKTRQWRFPVRQVLHDKYMSPDTRDDAIRYFEMNHYPKGKQITAQEYDRIKQEYDASCRRNGEQ
ncbi:MAG TPA: hypothetical protein PLU30_25125 [Verrucomicrobiae bacterium]|nr:hypothetical protein [Verrucomicrobiae bacterium]